MGNQPVRSMERRPRAFPCFIPAVAGASILLLASPCSAAETPAPVNAAQAIETQKEALRNVISPHCSRGEEEVVVCGRRTDRERVPFPDQQVAGARTHLQPGEAPSAVTAMNRSDPPCNSTGAPRCGFSISFITVGILLFKLGKHVADPDSDPPPTPIGAEATPPD
jgi:hypothetical protein